MHPIKVLLFDDNIEWAKATQAVIECFPELEWAGHFFDTQNVIEKITQLKPDVILLDVQMRTETEGIEATKQIHEASFENDMKVIIQTDYSNQKTLLQAIRAGAAGFISKKDDISNFVNTIKNIYTNKCFITPETAFNLTEKLSDCPLSDRELQILVCFSEDLTDKQTADKLYISQSTVSTHAKNIYQKIGVTKKAGAVGLAFRKNWFK